MEGGGKEIAGAAQMLGNEYIVKYRLALPQAYILEGAGHSQSRDFIRRRGQYMVREGILIPLLLGLLPSLQSLVLQGLLRGKLRGIHGGMLTLVGLFHLAGGVIADDALFVEAHPAVGGGVHTGDDIERRGLSCAVGADKGHDLALVYLHGQVIHGHHAAELHSDIFHLQHIFHLEATSFADLSFFLHSFLKKLKIPSQENSRSPMMPLRKNSTTIIMTTENTSIRKPPRMKGMFTPR